MNVTHVAFVIGLSARLTGAAGEWRVAQDGRGEFCGTNEAPLLAAIERAQKSGGGVITVGPGTYLIEKSLVFKDAKGVTLRGERGAVLQLKPALATELATAAQAGAKKLALRSLDGVAPGVTLRILAPGEVVAFTGKPRLNFTAVVERAGEGEVTLRAPLAFPAPAATRVLNDQDPNLLIFSGACEDVSIEGLTLDGALRPDGLRQAAHHTRCGVWIEGAYSYEKGPLGPKPKHIVVRDCAIRNFHGRGVAIYSGEECAVERCDIENVLDEGVDFDHFAVRCRATDNRIRAAPVGVELNDANDCVVARNEIASCDTGIRVWRWCKQDGLNVRNAIVGNRLRDIRGRAVELQVGTSANAAQGNVLEVAAGADASPAVHFADQGAGNRMSDNRAARPGE